MTVPPIELIIDLSIRYGFQVLGAMIVLAAGLLVARWIGNVVSAWTARQHIEPPARMLLVRIVRMVVILLTVVVVLGNLGIQMSPFLAGIGVAGLGIGLALQGVLAT